MSYLVDTNVLLRLVQKISPFLRRVRLADAATSGASGLLMMLCAGLAEGPLGVPTLLRYAGLRRQLPDALP